MCIRDRYTPIRKGKYYSLKEHDSVIIDPVGNMFWRNAYRGEPHWCGSIIDFICHFEGKSEREAILELSDLAGGVHSVPAEPCLLYTSQNLHQSK